MEVNELLDAAKAGRGFGSDYALAKALNVSRSAVSEWRQGKRHPDTVNCEKLAVFSGFPLHVVLGTVGEARAISTDEKRVWRKLAAALFVSMLAVPTAYARPTSGLYEATNGNGSSVHYAKFRKILRDIARHIVTIARRYGDRHGPLPAL